MDQKLPKNAVVQFAFVNRVESFQLRYLREVSSDRLLAFRW